MCHGSRRLLLALFLSLCFLAPGSPRAVAAVIYVNQAAEGAVHDGSAWATAALTLRAGLAAAKGGDEVWVARGTYVESVTVSARIALYGGFAGAETERDQRNAADNVTVLDGNQAPAALNLSIGGSTVDGFTIRNSKNNGIIASGDVVISNNVLTATGSPNGAVQIALGSATISRNVIASNAGVGIRFEQNGAGTVTDNVISGNTVGIEIAASSLVSVRGNAITGNSGSFGAIHLLGGNASISGTTITGSKNAAVWVAGGGSAAISDTQITGNGGGVHIAEGNATLTNVTLTANGAYSGSTSSIASISVAYGQASVINCLVARNERGLVIGPSGSVIVRYSDVWGNVVDDYAGLSDPTGTNGNISRDPKLSSLYRSVHLQPGSPCINGGNSYAAVDAADLYGKPRIQGGRVDIGADESDGTTWPSESRVWRVSPAGSDSQDGRSWETARRSIGSTLTAAQGGDEVWVAAGPDTPDIEVPLGVAVYGGFSGTESDRGQRDWRANVSQLGSVTCSRLGAAVDGFAIRNGVIVSGQADIANNLIQGPYPTRFGAGVLVTGVATLTDNTIRGNVRAASGGEGGGVIVLGTATLTRNLITGNSSS